MLPRKRRVEKAYFKAQTRGGITVSDPFFSIKTQFDQTLTGSKIAVIVSKKVAKTAVLRNSVRRRIYGIIEHIPIQKGFVCFVYPKKEVIEASQKNVQMSMKELFSKISAFAFNHSKSKV